MIDPAPPGASSQAILISEIQLLLAEKQTALALMRTGLAVCALPLSVCSLLIATSRYYDAARVLHLFVPVLLINAALLALAAYLIARAMLRLRALERMIGTLSRKAPDIAGLIQ